jgi:putative phosphoribosyl transferase
MRFHDRREAGRALGERLAELRKAGALPGPVLVLGLPRGGVPVGAEVARALDAPLDVLVARKIGAPIQPELAVGALAGDDPPLWDQRSLELLGLSQQDLLPLVDQERAELYRRTELYRRGRPAPELAGRSVVVVDDGLATGFTARAALRSVRGRQAARLVLAVPVGARDSVEALTVEADEVVCLYQPWAFGSVGRWYENFDQLSDADVLALLEQD